MPFPSATGHLRLHVSAYFGLVLAASIAGSTDPIMAQSFDCAKASTRIEIAICQNPSLADLDKQLAGVFRSRLDSDPAQREKLLTDERSWIAARDTQCLKAKADSIEAGGLLGCLARAYRERLADLQGIAGAGPTQRTVRPGMALCQAIEQKYRLLLANAPGAGKAERFYPDDVLRNLTRMKSSGVFVADSLINGVEADKLPAWAKAQNPPFSIPANLIDAIKKNTDATQDLDHPPGSSVYIVNGTAGSLYCYQPGVYFKVEDSQAVATAAPNGWDNDTSCLVSRSVGSVDGTPVAFEIETNISRMGDYSLNVTPWTDGHFGPGCTATFRFSQRLSALGQENADHDADECNGNSCDQLKAAAWKLVETVQAHAQSTGTWRKTQIARLTPAQATRFKTMVAKAGGDRNSGAEPTADQALMTSPLLLPLFENGELYLAKVGHLYSRGISLPGWRIVLQQLKNGELDESDQASFSVDMRGDHLIDVTIK